jgi:hypothetical protein
MVSRCFADLSGQRRPELTNRPRSVRSCHDVIPMTSCVDSTTSSFPRRAIHAAVKSLSVTAATCNVPTAGRRRRWSYDAVATPSTTLRPPSNDRRVIVRVKPGARSPTVKALSKLLPFLILSAVVSQTGKYILVY